MQEKSRILDFARDFVFEKQYGNIEMPFAHVHPQYELYFFPRAVRQRLVVNGQEAISLTACIAISKPYTVHSMQTLEPCPPETERYVIYFTEAVFEPKDIESIFKEENGKNFGIIFKLTDEESEYYSSLVKILDPESEFPLKKADRERFIPFLLSRIISGIPRERTFKMGNGENYVQDVMRSIHNSIFSDTLISTDEIARIFSVSRSKLERDFKASCGTTVREFINMCRISRIMALIRSDKNFKMSEIAEKCSFKSETYLFAFFKKYTGVSPKEYKNSIKKEESSRLGIALATGGENGKNYIYGCR